MRPDESHGGPTFGAEAPQAQKLMARAPGSLSLIGGPLARSHGATLGWAPPS